jgi:hypothetical protein
METSVALYASVARAMSCVARSPRTRVCCTSPARSANAGNDLARGLAIDSQGGVILVGQFGGEIELADGAVDFGEGPIRSRGDFDAVVASLDAAGRPRWGRSLGGAGFDVAKTVRIDADGDLYVVGSLDLETTPPKSPDDWRLEGFLARYSARLFCQRLRLRHRNRSGHDHRRGYVGPEGSDRLRDHTGLFPAALRRRLMPRLHGGPRGTVPRRV